MQQGGIDRMLDDSFCLPLAGYFVNTGDKITKDQDLVIQVGFYGLSIGVKGASDNGVNTLLFP
jgi:hypothetical protein